MVLFMIQAGPGYTSAKLLAVDATGPSTGEEVMSLMPQESSSLPVALPSTDPSFEAENSTPRFLPGEIVRKSRALRKRVLDPNLGVVLQIFTTYEPVTYKVHFFNGEDNQRDIYWEEDLMKLNPMETGLFLNDYPEDTREEILRLSRCA